MTAASVRIAWLFDIGSTFTKLNVVDLDTGVRLHCAQSPTTVETDVREGMNRAIGMIEGRCRLRFAEAIMRRASSSAAGGLALVVSGLVPRLSLEAGRIASLGAGAKLVGTWAYGLNRADLQALARARPDVVLLTGGTDGGDREHLLRNARALASLDCPATILVAGNRNATDEAAAILRAAGRNVRIAPNIMPEVERIDVDPVREVIRNIFLQEIVRAKGIDRASEMLNGEILPTPCAVLDGVQYLAESVLQSEVIAIEVGGATTNVHSFALGSPRDPTTRVRGFTEPRLKRTVEGDLGVRYNADTILEQARVDHFRPFAPDWTSERIAAYIAQLPADPAHLPANDTECAIDEALAIYAARTGLARHCGRLEQLVLPTGVHVLQRGKDLRDVPVLLLTGGSLINARNITQIAACILKQQDPQGLTPQEPRVLMDQQYVLYAAGLLAIAGEGAAAGRVFTDSLTTIKIPRRAKSNHASA